jgi:CheY-like chemotaxis protein
MATQNNESIQLKVLLLEDDPFDAELIIAMLEESGFKCVWQRVEKKDDFLEQLQRPDPFELILADYNLPSFNGLDALALAKKLHMDIPFILVSGTVGEELAVDCLKAGATDYVLKDRLFRLGYAVKRALLEVETKQAQMQAQMQANLASKKLEELGGKPKKFHVYLCQCASNATIGLSFKPLDN